MIYDIYSMTPYVICIWYTIYIIWHVVECVYAYDTWYIWYDISLNIKVQTSNVVPHHLKKGRGSLCFRAHRYAKYIPISGFLVLLWSPLLVVAVLRLRVNFDWVIAHFVFAMIYHWMCICIIFYMTHYVICIWYIIYII